MSAASHSQSDPFGDLKEIYAAGVREVSPLKLIRRNVSLADSILTVLEAGQEVRLDLGSFRRIWVLGAGKASAPMAAALEEVMGERIERGLVVVKHGHTDTGEASTPRRIEILQAGHPVPDADGLEAARRIEALARDAREDTLVIGLLSGGGSALLPAPCEFLSEGRKKCLRLEDLQETTTALLSCGATIQEINCIRKHLSRLKGGRLARLLYPARSFNLILSDVVGDRLDTIASGLTVADPTTYADALGIVRRYGIERHLPHDVLELLALGAEGALEETPKPGSKAFARVQNVLLGTNYTGLVAAAQRSAELGYRPVVLSSRVVGEAREVARVLAAVALEQAQREVLGGNPVCLLAGGETTVTIHGDGLGGRNQELALAFLQELADAGAAGERVWFLSASTDGNDGPTDAAGAYASLELLRRARTRGLDPAAHLHRNDSYRFFAALGGLLITGPTNTNVCDFMLTLVEKNTGEENRS
jgi:glycerate 2-kinase